MPAASSAGVYGLGPPGSQPSTAAPAQPASSAAADAPAPAAPTTWIRSPAAIGRAARAAASPCPMSAASRTLTRAAGTPRPAPLPRPDPRAPRRPAPAAAPAPPAPSRACSRSGRRATGSAAPSSRPRPATATYTSPTGFASVPPSGPATPVTPTPRSARSRSRAPSAMAIATCADTAPCASSTSAGTPSSRSLTGFEYATIAAREVRGRPGHLGDQVGDEAARARLGRRERQSPRHAPRLEALGELDERVRHVRSGRCGPARRVARTATSRDCSPSTSARGPRR